jgi:hypothetical protein
VAIEGYIWLYWLFCLLATMIVVANKKFAEQLLYPDADSTHQENGYKISLVLGWVTTLIAAVIYVMFTIKTVTGSYQLPDLILFAFVNGVLEQFMFIFWFLVGCYLGQKQFPNKPITIFICGYISYVFYSGLIHPFFWFQILPKHEPFTPMAFILPFMSIFWMWLLWRYRAVGAIIAMHIVIDFLTIGHLHFHWFESIQFLTRQNFN